MFMFVFAVILIAIVGLFFQVVNALVLFLAGQQMAMGQQIYAWQNMAKEYACTSGLSPAVKTTGTLSTSDSAITSGIRSIRPDYKGVDWNTAIFDGTYGGTGTRLVLSYITPGASYGGLSSGEVTRQFRATFQKADYRLSPVFSDSTGTTCPAGEECMNTIINVSGQSPLIIAITGIPTAAPNAVPEGVSGIITSVTCP